MRIDALWINEKDNVVTALKDINTAENVCVGGHGKIDKVVVKEKIPFGNKFA